MIRLTIEDGVAEIVLDAPEKLNSLGPEGIAELSAAYAEASDAGVRALLLRGEGRAFCAGRDISGVDPREDDVIGYLEGLIEPLMKQMSEFPAPTFAVAHGACLGVGLGLLIASDVVYVAESAKIGSPFANLGATLDSGGHALFFERLGAHRTLDLSVGVVQEPLHLLTRERPGLRPTLVVVQMRNRVPLVADRHRMGAELFLACHRPPVAAVDQELAEQP